MPSPKIHFWCLLNCGIVFFITPILLNSRRFQLWTHHSLALKITACLRCEFIYSSLIAKTPVFIFWSRPKMRVGNWDGISRQKAERITVLAPLIRKCMPGDVLQAEEVVFIIKLKPKHHTDCWLGFLEVLSARHGIQVPFSSN